MLHGQPTALNAQMPLAFAAQGHRACSGAACRPEWLYEQHQAFIQSGSGAACRLQWLYQQHQAFIQSGSPPVPSKGRVRLVC